MSLLLSMHTNGHPLEREFEGWICWKIKDYFEELPRRALVRAFHVQEEMDTKADVMCKFSGKLLGLQFKRPYYDNKGTKFRDLYWDINLLQLLVAVSVNQNAKKIVILYSLPTFLNSDARKISLHHCLFISPECLLKQLTLPKTIGKKTVKRFYMKNWSCFYSKANNGRAKKGYDTNVREFCCTIDHRWGSVVEKVDECDIGFVVRNVNWNLGATFKKRLENAKKTLDDMKASYGISTHENTAGGDGVEEEKIDDDVMLLVGLEVDLDRRLRGSPRTGLKGPNPV